MPRKKVVVEEVKTNIISSNEIIEVKSERELPTCNVAISCAEDLIKYYNQSTKIICRKKKGRGEVFTPTNLVIEMLDKLPLEVWSNPELKWLDPASGIGIFPLIVYMRLMIGLQEEIPDVEQRRKHILKNMITMIEFDKENCRILKMIFNGNENNDDI